MSAQMNLLAQPSEERIEVPACRSVLHHGSRAASARDEPLFPHRHVPHRPAKVAGEEEWMAALDFAEEARRFEQAPRAVLQLGLRSIPSPSGRSGPGVPRLWADSRGVKVNDTPIGWPRLLAGRTEQREIEPEVARARDLAEAYHYLDYYGWVYGEPEESDGFGERWSAVPLIRGLAEEAIALGGDPTQLDPRTPYMRQGIEEATRQRHHTKEEAPCT